VTKRVYREAMTHDQAMDIIFMGRETHFDTAVFYAFQQVSHSLRKQPRPEA
jgi:HD-GYP domain-containing protein (c-di-GMP phosphodiesterase class II)